MRDAIIDSGMMAFVAILWLFFAVLFMAAVANVYEALARWWRSR